MTRFYRISEITRPHGPVGKSKLYADARAGLIEIRKIGGMSIVTDSEWIRYLAGEPIVRGSRRAA